MTGRTVTARRVGALALLAPAAWAIGLGLLQLGSALLAATALLLLLRLRPAGRSRPSSS